MNTNWSKYDDYNAYDDYDDCKIGDRGAGHLCQLTDRLETDSLRSE